MAFYDKLKTLREESNISQRKMAKLLGISQQAYSTYELGINEPSLSSLVKIADILEVSTDYLLDRVNEYALLWQPNNDNK